MTEETTPLPDVEPLAIEVGHVLRDKGWYVATAESCTGGLLASWLTDVPGSSDYVLGGIVAYANEAKCNLLGVRKETLRKHGAVSAACARELAQGALQHFGATMAVAITGIAGPGGVDDDQTGRPDVHQRSPRARYHRRTTQFSRQPHRCEAGRRPCGATTDVAPGR